MNLPHEKEFNPKQQHILEISEKLFATKGYNGTSVREIAQTAGVNLAMISYYFGSKEKLLEAVFEMRTQEIRQQIEEMLQNTTQEPLDKMFRLLESYVSRIMNQQHFHKLMIRQQISEEDSAITQLIKDTKKRNQDSIKKLISEGQRKGVFKKNIDVPLMMMTLFGTVNYMLSAQHHYREINDLRAMPEPEFQKLISKKLITHLKTIFKAILLIEQ